MSRPIKIGIAGTHSTGKTKFLQALQNQLLTMGVRASSVSIGDVAREAKRLGFGILHAHTCDSTAWIISGGISRELEASLTAPVVLVDRPVPDAMGYLFAALEFRKEELDKRERRYLEGLVALHATTYTRIFLSELDMAIPLDTTKERDDDPIFRVAAARGIKRILEDLHIPYQSLPSAGRDRVMHELATEIQNLVSNSR